VSGEKNLALLYRVDDGGTLRFGGGADARLGRTSWSGAMSPQEIHELQSLLERCGWFEREPRTSGEPRTLRTRIAIRWPGGSRRYTLRGSSPDVEPVVAWLDRLARRRFDEVLRALQPQAPGEPQRAGEPQQPQQAAPEASPEPATQPSPQPQAPPGV
jgi:hypothetical protein